MGDPPARRTVGEAGLAKDARERDRQVVGSKAVVQRDAVGLKRGVDGCGNS